MVWWAACSQFRTPPHVSSPESGGASTSRQPYVSCTGCQSVDVWISRYPPIPPLSIVRRLAPTRHRHRSCVPSWWMYAGYRCWPPSCAVCWQSNVLGQEITRKFRWPLFCHHRANAVEQSAWTASATGHHLYAAMKSVTLFWTFTISNSDNNVYVLCITTYIKMLCCVLPLYNPQFIDFVVFLTNKLLPFLRHKTDASFSNTHKTVIGLSMSKNSLSALIPSKICVTVCNWR